MNEDGKITEFLKNRLEADIPSEPPRMEAIMEAARLAAYHSKAKESTNVPVDYTLVKNVSKPAGAKPGMVIYVKNKTVYVDPALPKPISDQ